MRVYVFKEDYWFNPNIWLSTIDKELCTNSWIQIENNWWCAIWAAWNSPRSVGNHEAEGWQRGEWDTRTEDQKPIMAEQQDQAPGLTIWWRGPFTISHWVSTSEYELTVPLSMIGLHPVFYVQALRIRQPNSIIKQIQPNTKPVIIHCKAQWMVEVVLNTQQRDKLKYMINFQAFGPNPTLEPSYNPSHC